MTRLQRSIRELGGMAATHELRLAGFGRETLRLATRTGEIRRIRKGWYILPDIPSAIADCARVGGRATCATAIEHAGLWLRERPTAVHVAVRPNACQLRDPRDYRRRHPYAGAIVHWTDAERDGGRMLVPLPGAIREAVGCLGVEEAFVALESALSAGRISRSDLPRIVAGLPAAARVSLLGVHGMSDSITEAVYLFRSSAFGVRVRQQVQIGPDRVDFVLGDRLIVELDSREFHEKERDYARDARLVARGYRVLRFSYRQVMFEWPTVLAAVSAAIGRGDAA
ncbi:MAG: DUF559 domain-containing protein [Protaetiibacter sp.]